MPEPNLSETSTSASTNPAPWGRTGYGFYDSPYVTFRVEDKGKGINPALYFHVMKKQFGMIEKIKLDGFLNRIEKAFYRAIDNGQEALADKMLNELSRVTREAILYTKGIRYFIHKDDLGKYKHKIRGGHISDTVFEHYTRIIPEKILKKKKSLEGVFDNFVIYHAYLYEEEKKREKKQKMSQKEKGRMRDPVLFGSIKENPEVLYYIDEWTDDLCDLSFEEMVEVLGKGSIDKNPKLRL